MTKIDLLRDDGLFFPCPVLLWRQVGVQLELVVESRLAVESHLVEYFEDSQVMGFVIRQHLHAFFDTEIQNVVLEALSTGFIDDLRKHSGIHAGFAGKLFEGDVGIQVWFMFIHIGIQFERQSFFSWSSSLLFLYFVRM